MWLFFAALVVGFDCVFAQSVPSFCSAASCPAQDRPFMNWAEAAHALQLTYKRSFCVPDIEALPQGDDDVSWVLRANQWKIHNRVGQASLLQGDLLFVSESQTLKSDVAWLWRSADGGLDKLCLPERALWSHAAWKVAASQLTYRLDADDIRACDGAFVLNGVNDQPLYGYAQEVSLASKHVLTLKKVHTTACPMHQRTWSISADHLDWYAQEKRAVIKKARMYFYDKKVATIPKLEFTVGGDDAYGWQMPQLASYDDDFLAITFPYRLRSKRMQIIAPWIGSSGGIGGLYQDQYHRAQRDEQVLLRAGLYLDDPTWRYGGVIKGQYRHLYGADTINYQLLHMRDGWYGQYFYPQILETFRPNKDLPSYIDYQKTENGLQGRLAVVYYQKFSGDKLLQDEIAVPYLHVLPRINLAYQRRALDAAVVFENLVSESQKDNYPGTTRALAYLGGRLIRQPHMQLQLGAWVKQQEVDAYSAWAQYNQHHYFWAPNVAFSANRSINQTLRFDFSYAYTKTVDQSLDPVFQRQWQWLGGQPDFDKLISVDRVYDRNRIWIGLSGQGGVLMPEARYSVKHIIDLRDPKVTLSDDGAEDPLIASPSGVSLFTFNDSSSNLTAQGVWVWPLQRMQYYDLQWRHKRLSLSWLRRPDVVSVQDQVVSVPANRILGADLDVFNSDLSRLHLGVDYQSGLDRSLKYQLSWLMSRCCWQGKASVSLIKWMSDSSIQDVFTGWQPRASFSFSLKGLSSVSRV